MRALSALIFLLLFTPAGLAQMDTDEAHQVRVAYGDIPTTNLVEGDDTWNFQEKFLISVGESLLWTTPSGHTMAGVGCQGCTTSVDGGDAPTYNVTCTGSDTDICAVAINHLTTGEKYAFGASIALRADSVVVVFSPRGSFVNAAIEPGIVLGCTEAEDDCTINRFDTGALSSFWFTISPTAPASSSGPAATPAGGFGTIELIVGLLAGAAVWYALVRGGYVQKRQRKQIAGAVAHKEVAKKEDKATLEGRKRVLMAALKELELAKMNKQIETAAYDALKADFKKQAVTVMRALEE